MNKRMIFGSIMLVLGMVCASGDTIANGIMACVFIGVAAIAFRSVETANETANENENKDYAYKKAA